MTTSKTLIELYIAFGAAALISYLIPAIPIQWAYFLILSMFVLLED